MTAFDPVDLAVAVLLAEPRALSKLKAGEDLFPELTEGQRARLVLISDSIADAAESHRAKRRKRLALVCPRTIRFLEAMEAGDVVTTFLIRVPWRVGCPDSIAFRGFLVSQGGDVASVAAEIVGVELAIAGNENSFVSTIPIHQVLASNAMPSDWTPTVVRIDRGGGRTRLIPQRRADR